MSNTRKSSTADSWLTLINQARTARVQAGIDAYVRNRLLSGQSAIDSWGTWH